MQITKQGCSTQQSFLTIFLQLYYFTISFHMCGYGEDKKLSRSKLHVTSLNSGLQSSLLIAGLLYNVLTQSSGNYLPELSSNHILSFRSNLWKKYKDLITCIAKKAGEALAFKLNLFYIELWLFTKPIFLAVQDYVNKNDPWKENIVAQTFLLASSALDASQAENLNKCNVMQENPAIMNMCQVTLKYVMIKDFFLMTSSPMLVKLLRQS